jgi:hypothetical protein
VFFEGENQLPPSDNMGMTNTPDAQVPSTEDPMTTMAQACAQLDAITDLLSKAGGATVSCAHMSALLAPLSERLQTAHERLDSGPQ